MTTHTREDTPIDGAAATRALREEVGSWPGVQVDPHRFGGVAFNLGRRELGHLHPDVRGASFADLPFPRRVRDALIAAGRARVHGALPDSGWLTVPIRTEADLRGAIEIFRLSYERASQARERRRGA
jgi:Luciferase